MIIKNEQHELFACSTGEQLDTMNQALRIACLFEHDLLSQPCNSVDTISIQNFIDCYGVSRSIGHEAIRILQHRNLLQSKRGPNGGLHVTAPGNKNLVSMVSHYLLYNKVTQRTLEEAKDTLVSIASSLSSDNLMHQLIGVMLEAVKGNSILALGQMHSQHENGKDLCAEQIAKQIVFAVIGNAGIQGDLRIGHEDEWCERFDVSKPVVRQAIRILESDSLVRSNRGRGRGLFLTRPQPGPLVRLISLWLFGKNAELQHVFSLERPLRLAMAMMASERYKEANVQYLGQLQNNFERDSSIGFTDLIQMEGNIAWLAVNPLLDLLLRSMTVYKICRHHYLTMIENGKDSYGVLNAEFLSSLFSGNESAIENICEEKNNFFQELDQQAKARTQH